MWMSKLTLLRGAQVTDLGSQLHGVLGWFLVRFANQSKTRSDEGSGNRYIQATSRLLMILHQSNSPCCDKPILALALPFSHVHERSHVGVD
jgi:hypothetical protein